MDSIEELKFRCKTHNQPIVYVCSIHLELACKDCFIISHKNCGGSPESGNSCRDKINHLNENFLKKAERVSAIKATNNFKALTDLIQKINLMENKTQSQLIDLESLRFYRSMKEVVELNLNNYTLQYHNVEEIMRFGKDMNFLIEEIQNPSQSSIDVDLKIKSIYSKLPSNKHIKLMSRYKKESKPNVFIFSIIPNIQNEITITGVGLGAPCQQNWLEVSALEIYTTNKQSKEESCIMRGLCLIEIQDISTEIILDNPVRSAPGKDIRFTIDYSSNQGQYHVFDTPFLHDLQIQDIDKSPLISPQPVLYLLIS